MKNFKNVRFLINDVMPCLIALTFIIIGIYIKYWFGMAFFSFCLLLLLLKYIFPHIQIFNPGGTETEEEKRYRYFNSNGIFSYYNDGFSVTGHNDSLPLKWENIKEVIAYKEDLLYVDEIYFFCCV